MMTPAQAQLLRLYEDLAYARTSYSLADVYDEEDRLTTYIDATLLAIEAMKQAGVRLPEDAP